MKVAFMRAWHEHKRGDVVDMHPLQAHYLWDHGIVRYITEPHTVTLADLQAPLGAETATAEPRAERAVLPRPRKRKRVVRETGVRISHEC